MAKIKRNSRCPCGSGKKYKHCCSDKDNNKIETSIASGRTRFEPGSYGGASTYFPSLLCYRETEPDQWEEYYCLVKQDASCENEQTATAMAEEHLEEAFEKKQISGNMADVALSLRGNGYIKVEDFRIVGK